MRKTSIVALTTALILAAAPAGAKVPAEVEITGPGLATPLVLGDPEAFEYANLSGIAGFREGVRAPQGTDPSGDLGPRYVVRFILHMSTPREAVQHLYPFADGGPVVYTPAGQRLFTGPAPLEGGWAYPDAALLDLLRSSGLPEPSADGGVADIAAEPSRAAAFIALVILGGLAFGVAAIERRRRVAPA